jgi:hypothetical protein
MNTQPYPVRLPDHAGLERSRLTVFFRAILVIPHLIVLTFYGIAAFFAIIVAWFAALFTGRVPAGLHGFIAGYLRYSTRVTAYLLIMADPYPPFGSGGTYPVDLEVDAPAKQGRLGVFFRYLLAIPCLIVTGILQYLMYFVAIGCWFVALFTGKVPEGLQNVGMWCLRFQARTHAYVTLINPRYPTFDENPGGSLPADLGSLPPVP